MCRYVGAEALPTSTLTRLQLCAPPAHSQSTDIDGGLPALSVHTCVPTKVPWEHMTGERRASSSVCTCARATAVNVSNIYTAAAP